MDGDGVDDNDDNCLFTVLPVRRLVVPTIVPATLTRALGSAHSRRRG